MTDTSGNVIPPRMVDLLEDDFVAAEWNAKHPIGTRVGYFPVMPPSGCPLMTVTRSQAWMLGSRAVVLVAGRAGCVALTHIEVIND